MTTLNKKNLSLFKACTSQAMFMAGVAQTTCGGVKKVAKLTKSACDALKKIHETYKKVPNKAILSANNAASRFTDVLSFLEPVILVKECTYGEKNGIRPWEHFRRRGSCGKGVSWALKKTKGTAKLAKRLHSLQVVNLTFALTPFVVLGVICDLGTSTIKMVNKGVEFKKSWDTSIKLQGRLIKWNGRVNQADFTAEICKEKLEKINDKIRAQEKIKKRCAFKIACAIGLWVLTIFCIIALVVQMPYLNLALLAIGFGCNLSSAMKLGAEILFKNKKNQAQSALNAPAASSPWAFTLEIS